MEMGPIDHHGFHSFQVVLSFEYLGQVSLGLVVQFSPRHFVWSLYRHF